jgi:hypothetical protein
MHCMGFRILEHLDLTLIPVTSNLWLELRDYIGPLARHLQGPEALSCTTVYRNEYIKIIRRPSTCGDPESKISTLESYKVMDRFTEW